MKVICIVIFIFCFAQFSYGANITATLDSSDGSSAFLFSESGSTVMASIDSAGNLQIKGGLRLDSGGLECTSPETLIVDGKVGIGTVNPGEKLDVNGNLQIGSASGGKLGSGVYPYRIYWEYSDDGTGYGPSWIHNNTTSGNKYPTMFLKTNSDSASLTIDDSISLGDMTLASMGVYPTITTRTMISGKLNQDSYFDNGGNVGIGITTPGVSLEVDGSVTVRKGLRLDTGGAACNTAEMLIVDGKVGVGTIDPKTELDVNGYVKSTVPAFHASNSAAVAAVQYIAFDTVSLNVGNCYNSANGRFTAPVDGLYFFSWGGIENPNSTVSRTYLYVNGVNTGPHLRLDGSNTFYDGGSLSRAVLLSAGDWAAVYLGAGGIYQSYGTFTGFLIAAQ